MTPRHPRNAIDAVAICGKGRQHKAALNYGNCFVYALAKATGRPFLFKGNDFSHTDLSSVP
jgi:ribonuclease VapC